MLEIFFASYAGET